MTEWNKFVGSWTKPLKTEFIRVCRSSQQLHSCIHVYFIHMQCVIETSIFIIHLLHQNGVINVKANHAFIIFKSFRCLSLNLKQSQLAHRTPYWEPRILPCRPKEFFRMPSQYLSSLLKNIIDLHLKLAINIKECSFC